eukprot:TRINITY_DN57_c0_g2_i1.p1 TRINITY_DN57_c0_g2~~TRINITY_DN57_c0_g2_i1.p1  ORF type:complete len:488 (-),score=31.15 TRINITY_DN57_c0_g2_i1:160-1623(-)
MTLWRDALIFLLALCSVAVVVCDVNLNQVFSISVRGTFRHTSSAEDPFDAKFNCDFCDDGVSQTFVDGFTCPTATSFGADDNEQRWGTQDRGTPYTCFPQSGAGFQGVSGITLQANSGNNTRIGTFSHYNNAIVGARPGNPPSSPTALRLLITMSSPQLSQNFVTAFPLSFVETPNLQFQCDPSIQRTSEPCDDRFSFDAFSPSESFVSDNVRYTLIVTGFISDNSSTPLRQFITREGEVSRASVYAQIVTYCVEPECGANEVFVPAPTCGCECALTNKTCQTVFPDAETAVDDATCSCGCIKDPNSCNATNPDIGAFNVDSCSCGCNLTNSYCKSQNPLWTVKFGGNPCECACNPQKFIECAAINRFYEPTGDKCVCACVATDDLCKETYGKNYRVNKDKCSCFVPGPYTGLTDGQIAGIVVASVLGPLLLLLIMAIIAGVVFYLIWTGVIPGVWGYKIEQGAFGAGGNSSLYQSPWQSNSNVAAG